MEKKKRKDECLFCGSRKCYTRIYRRDVPMYDEIACGKHVEELQDHADKILGRRNGIMRSHVSGTGTYKRGEVYSWELEKNNLLEEIMNIKEFAKMLNGREYGSEITKGEVKQAKELGFVVVYGYSDDNMIFEGAIDDEFGCYDGGIATINENGLVEECECNCAHYKEALNNATKIEACWWNGGPYTWTYETKIPHEKFDILEDGEKWCQGIIFDIKSL